MSEHGSFSGYAWLEETVTKGGNSGPVDVDLCIEGRLNVCVEPAFQEPDEGPRTAWVRIEVAYPTEKGLVGRAVYIDPDKFLAAAAAVRVLIARVKKDEKA
jgi:hypothetical protein